MASGNQLVLPFGPGPEKGSPEDNDPTAASWGLPSGSIAEEHRKAAECGNGKDQYLLAQMYHYGCSGVARDHVQAFVWYTAAKARGYTDAGWNLPAVSRGLSSAELAEAEFLVGNMYEESDRVPRNPREAAAWYRKAARKGHAAAQLSLGKMHETERGLPADIIKAHAWLAVAARQGNETAKHRMSPVLERMTESELAEAYFRLGEMYRSGKAIPTDESEALYWHRKAAGEGNAKAEFALGEMYRFGEAVAANASQALQWYRKAANHGLAEAQRELGDMCLEGEGTAKNSVQGLAWLYLAAMQGAEGAESSKRHAEKRMTATQISEATKMSREYKARIEGC